MRVVELARKNGYLASTADSIAVYHTAVLLAQMRNRRHPSPYDFRDAAVTCLEKDRIPGKRNVSHRSTKRVIFSLPGASSPPPPCCGSLAITPTG